MDTTASSLVNYDKFKSKEEAIDKLMVDVKRFRVSLPDNFQVKMLHEGYGEGVCFIINDLTNRELIRKNFKFELFKMTDDPNQMMEAANSVEEDMIIEGSTIFSNTMMFDPKVQEPGSHQRMSVEYVPSNRGKKHDSKDLTTQANNFKN